MLLYNQGKGNTHKPKGENKMTIKELYDWAVKNGVENYEFMPLEEDHNYSFSEEDLYIYPDDGENKFHADVVAL